MLQPLIALEHFPVHPQSPFLRPRTPRALSGLLYLFVLRSAGGRSNGLDVCHDHPKEPFSNLHNGLGVLLRLPVPPRKLLLQALHRILGVFQEVGTLRFDFLDDVIEEGDDFRDFTVERASEIADEIHIESLGDRGDRRGKLEREIVQNVFDRFTTLALSVTLGELRVEFGIGFGGGIGGRGRDEDGEIGVVGDSHNILGRSTDDILIRVLVVVLCAGGTRARTARNIWG